LFFKGKKLSPVSWAVAVELISCARNLPFSARRSIKPIFTNSHHGAGPRRARRNKKSSAFSGSTMPP
jgi:hypothetical protein